MSLIRDTGGLLIRPLSHDTNCCCSDVCCCLTGTQVSQVSIAVTGMKEQPSNPQCDPGDCLSVNDTYILPLDVHACYPNPEPGTHSCLWQFIQYGDDTWCASSTLNALTVGAFMEYFDNTGLLRAEIDIVLNPFGGLTTAMKWEWNRSKTVVGGMPFDCLTESNLIDFSGAADTYEYPASAPWCDITSDLRVAITFA